MGESLACYGYVVVTGGEGRYIHLLLVDAFYQGGSILQYQFALHIAYKDGSFARFVSVENEFGSSPGRVGNNLNRRTATGSIQVLNGTVYNVAIDVSLLNAIENSVGAQTGKTLVNRFVSVYRTAITNRIYLGDGFENTAIGAALHFKVFVVFIAFYCPVQFGVVVILESVEAEEFDGEGRILSYS